MRRIIEDLVEKRKRQQEKLKDTFTELGTLIQHQGLINREKKRFSQRLFKKKSGGNNDAANNDAIKQKFLEVNDNINQLMTIQDKEWDAYSNNHSSMIFKSLQWKVEKLEAEYTNVRTILTNFVALEQSLDRLIASLDEKSGADAETVARLKNAKEQLSTYQYSDFEQRFRGGGDAVKDKLKAYLPVFASCRRVLDIGCGRGEFMELLKEEGKHTEGIDLSQSMLQVARENGLNVRYGDALDYLKKQPRGEWDGMFSAQVIEHMEPDYLRELVIEAFRVLAPKGPIVLETVNPLSLFALSNIYFLDVTHRKPLHPEFMRYLFESCGFSDVDIIYSGQLEDEQLDVVPPDRPNAREFNSNIDKLNKLLYSSPVYAVTGIKK